MFSRFDKAHVAALTAALGSILTGFVPDMPAEVVAGIVGAIAWVLTYEVPNKG